MHGNEIKGGDIYGYKVTHNITKLEMCIVADEVGGDTSHKGGKMVERALLLTEPRHIQH